MNTLERAIAHERVPLADIAAFLAVRGGDVLVDVVRYTEHVDDGPRRIPCNELCLRLDEDAAETLVRVSRIPRHTPDTASVHAEQTVAVVRWTDEASGALSALLDYLDGIQDQIDFYGRFADHPPPHLLSTQRVVWDLLDQIAPDDIERPALGQAA
ncbi:MAG: hypothetical protein AAGF99_18140 [Bacteroidota bacterium]